MRNVNSSLTLGVSVRTHGSEVTRLDATDLGAEVPSRAQKKILCGWYLGARTHGAELGATDLGTELEPLTC